MIQRYLNWKTLLILIALAIISGTVWYSGFLAKKIVVEERQRVQEWVASREVFMSANTDTKAINLMNLVAENNEDIPLILADDKDSILDIKNIDSAKINADSNYIKNTLLAFKALNTPIAWEISTDPLIVYKVYYGNTDLQNQVRYYPLVQLFLVGLFIIVALSLITTQNKSTQNQVWAGMAKETAHQMGTPLTSLQGWVEMLKDNPDDLAQLPAIVTEMEKDVERLKLVSDRFGKIGSSPQLIETSLVEQIEKMQEYIRRRASGKVSITFEKPAEDVTVMISPPLFDWVLENLLKNALDAMEGKGAINITLEEHTSAVYIDVADTGKGISPANIRRVFKPGFTTKKRGWGLGLSLSKRIMEQYHKGELFVKSSEPGKGTTFRIVINR